MSLRIILITLTLCVPLSYAQDAAPDCTTPLISIRPKGMISFGVLNAKARNLVKPPFPAAARAVGLRGAVVVSVAVDPQGCVVEAKAVSGHPMLRHGSEKAALASSFHPIHLSGTPIWVNGVIVYNYVSDTANWLEIGYFSGVRDRLSVYLSGELADMKTELDAAAELSLDEQQPVIERAIERIRLSLNSKPKELWLFDIGRQLGVIKNRNWSGPDESKKPFGKLRLLIVTAPEDIKPSFPKALRELLDQHPSSIEFSKRLSLIEERLYYFGT